MVLLIRAVRNTFSFCGFYIEVSDVCLARSGGEPKRRQRYIQKMRPAKRGLIFGNIRKNFRKGWRILVYFPRKDSERVNAYSQLIYPRNDHRQLRRLYKLRFRIYDILNDASSKFDDSIFPRVCPLKALGVQCRSLGVFLTH